MVVALSNRPEATSAGAPTPRAHHGEGLLIGFRLGLAIGLGLGFALGTVSGFLRFLGLLGGLRLAGRSVVGFRDSSAGRKEHGQAKEHDANEVHELSLM